MHTIAIVGAGATGAYLAAQFTSAGINVHLVARGRSADAIETEGIRVTHADGSTTVNRPAKVVRNVEDADEVDLVLFCVKGYDSSDASVFLTPLIGEKGKILCLQNGVHNEQLLAEIFGRDRVLSGVLYIGSERTAPGQITCLAAPRAVVGPYGNDDGSVELAAEIFRTADIPVVVEQNISQAKWEKFIFNCGLNPLTAITGAKLHTILSDPAGARAFEGLLDEAISVGIASGAPLDGESKSRVQATAARMDISSSMAEDLAAGRRIELDSFTGYVTTLGERLSVPTPYTEFAHGSLSILDLVNRGV